MIERQDIYQVLSTVIKLDPNVRKARVSPPVNWNYRHPSPAGQYISVSHAGVLKKVPKNEEKSPPVWDDNKNIKIFSQKIANIGQKFTYFGKKPTIFPLKSMKF